MSVVETEAKERRRAEAPAREPWYDRFLVRRPLPVFAAAAVLLLAGIGLGVALNGEDAPETRSFTGQTTMPGATAELRMRDDQGTLVVSGMTKPPNGRVYQVWVKHDGQAPQPTDALFTPARDGHASVAVPGDLTGVDQVLVTHEPEGGSSEPTVAPAIDIRT